MYFRHIAPIAVAAVMLISCEGHQKRDNGQSLEEISKLELATALEERDRLLALVKEVSVGLQQIKELENMMSIAATHPDENARQNARILADIASLKKKVQQRRKHLSELEDSLSDSTINNKELKETIGALRIQIDSQIDEIESLRQQLIVANERIGMLNYTVDSLNTTVSTVTGERNAALTMSERLENELNVCYYVVASKSELKKHNIIESGFLRKTRLMEGDFDKGFFVKADKRTLNLLQLNTRKARIMTNHHPSSYIIVDKAGDKVLEITDPDEFWSLTNYLVVMTD